MEDERIGRGLDALAALLTKLEQSVDLAGLHIEIDERTLTNLDRMAQLSVFGQGPKPKPVGPPFLFPFEFKVVRAVL